MIGAAVVGGLASSAYGWGPGYGYGYPGYYGGYAPAYYGGGYGYYDDYPGYYGGYSTVAYAPAYYGGYAPLGYYARRKCQENLGYGRTSGWGCPPTGDWARTVCPTSANPANAASDFPFFRNGSLRTSMHVPSAWWLK